MHNKLIGSLRIRQHRERKAMCPFIQLYNPNRKDFDFECYGPYGGVWPFSWIRRNEDETAEFVPRLEGRTLE